MKSKRRRKYGFRITPTLTAAFLLTAGTSLAASAAPASYARPARLASVTATPAAAVGCAYYNANLGYKYFSALKSTSLDWWGRGNSLNFQGTTVALGRVSGSSNLDCFHLYAGFGNSRVQVRLANSALCLAVSGVQAGTHIVLSNCLKHPTSELFNVYPGVQLKNAANGKCIDLSNGYRAGSLLVSKPCKRGDIYQEWYVHA